MEWLTLAVSFLCSLISFPLGYLGGRAHAIAQHRLQLAMELRLSDCEARLVKQAKIYAGNQSARSRSVDDELLEMAKRTVEVSAASKNQKIDPFYFPEG